MHAAPDDPKLRYVVGDDARSLIEGRQAISDEEYVALGGDVSDDEYAERYERIFHTRLD